MRARLFAEENRKWWTLGAVAFALFMVMLDNTVVNVALPSIQRDLGIGLSELQWTVNAYALTFAVLMLTGGKLADFMGRRRVFIAGLAVFTASSLACGLATSGEMLIAARTVQGIGAALMMPATLSIISATFPVHQRGMAIGVVAIVAARLLIRESRDTSADQRLDIPGLLTSAVALFALTFALIEANDYGWTSPAILSLFAIAGIGFVAFVLLELHQRVPMLDLSLFRNGTFAGANIVVLLVFLAMFGVFFFVSLYVQGILGYSAVQAGAIFLPM